MKRFLLIMSVLTIIFTGCKTSYKSNHTDFNQYATKAEVSVKTLDGVRLYGTLTLPKKVANPPIVLIIPGSGPVDRDGNAPKMKMNIYKILADSLAKHGIASLRYDKRGIGKSKVPDLDESALTIETYVNDADTWLQWIKNQKHFSQIIVLGHSEGSLIGILAAQKQKIDKFISVAGAGRPIDQVLKEQLQSQPKSIREKAFPIIDSLKHGKKVQNVPRQLYALFRPGVQPYLISWMKYDPAKEIAKLHIPILIIQGTTDLQVSTLDAKLLAQANPNAKLDIITGMNHIFRKAPRNRIRNLLTYTKPDLPIMHKFVNDIVEFIKQ